jgi:hypothetical protein
VGCTNIQNVDKRKRFDLARTFVQKSGAKPEAYMSIEVGARVTWRHGKSKPDKKGTRVPRGVANCIVIELAEDGRARIRLPESFESREVKVLLADLEDVE